MKYKPKEVIDFLQKNGHIIDVDDDVLKILMDYMSEPGQEKIQKELFKQLISDYVTLSKQLEKHVEDVTIISETDTLTQIANRIRIQKALEIEWSRSKRYHSPISLIVFDVDHFKNVNDTYGHDVGDEVLKTLAHIVKSNIRTTDLLGRWGGEEFMILVPTTNNTQAEWLAQKLRRAIESYDFPMVGQVTCSFGVADREAAMDIDDWLKIVEVALYKAKANGRNQVVDYETVIDDEL